MATKKRPDNKPEKRASAPVRSELRSTGVLSLLSQWRGFLLVMAGFYLLLLIFFAPVVFQRMGLSNAADMVAAAGMYRMGEEAIKSGHFPLWNPTLFSGMPLFASLQYALFTYPPEYIIRLFSFIFGGSDYRIWIFHYMLAALFVYLLARHYGLGRLTAWLAGVVYGFSPQLIVLADVGHGSKLMAMTWLPLIWLMLDRLRLKPSVGRAAALGAVFAVEILALHPQVAAYGALLMGIYLLYYGMAALRKKQFSIWGKFAGFWGGAIALSLALSAILWVSVLDYARFSIRGASEAGVAGGGVDWSYATGWSFHPLESITFLFPRFMGFGGETYWGTVGTPQGQPFTQNPMYFGCAALFLAVLAVATLPRSKWGYPAVLGLTAWVLSFGKYLPVLYSPLFHLLPLFNKFRAPVMGQVLLLLSVALLTGMGLEALIQRVRSGDSSDRLQRALSWTAGIAAGVGLLALVAPPLFNSLYRSFALLLKPGTPSKLLQTAGEMARPDVARVGLMLAVTAGLSALALKKKLAWQALVGVVVIVMLVDLWPINRRLVNFTPRSQRTRLFEAEGIVKKIQSDAGYFRIHPMDGQYRAVNWWSYFGLENTTGYFGAKPANYQKLLSAGLEGWGALYSRPQILDALNVRYIISSYPLNTIFGELQRRGSGEPARPFSYYTPVVMTRDGGYLYRNPGELPRARLVGSYRIIPDFDATLADMLRGGWDPRREVLLDRQPSLQPDTSGSGSAVVQTYEREKVVIKTSTTSPKLLVLADAYYPSGWQATMDGRPTEILRADGVLRAVAVPAGEHTVEFRFKPKLFYAGMWVSVVSLIGVLAIGGLALFKKRQSPVPQA